MNTRDIERRVVIDITLTHQPAQLWAHRERLFLCKRGGESWQHVAMKVLGWATFYHKEAVIEPTTTEHYRPDVAVFDRHGRPHLWLECGSTTLRKLDRLTRRFPELFPVIIKRSPVELERYAALAASRIQHPERVRYLSWSRPVVDRMAEFLEQEEALTLVISGLPGQLYIDTPGDRSEGESVLLAPRQT